MDTSETYIKMCDCEEIQSRRATKEGDVIYLRSGRVGVYPSCWAIDSVWLPLQHQLQEMVNCPLMNLIDSIREFYWRNLKENSGEDKFTSMEQLWLAFVMKEKHNKVWNGEKWVT